MSGKKNKETPLSSDVIAIIASAAIVMVLMSFAITALFAVPLALVCWGGWLIYKWQNNNPKALELKAKEHTQFLYDQTLAGYAALSLEDFGGRIYKRMPALPEELGETMILASLTLFDAESFAKDIPPPPAICNSIEGARYRDYLASLSVPGEEIAAKAADIISDSYLDFLRHLPPLGEDSKFTARLSDGLDDVGLLIENLILPYFDAEAKQLGLFSRLKELLIKNQYDASGVPYHDVDSPKLVMPSDYKGKNVVYAYLKDTPFIDFFNVPIPVDIPEKTRFEHSWCIAPPGTGKTQLIQYLVSHDLKLVEENKASVLVMDSAGDLIDQISSLNVFAPGQPLEGKLIVIRPDLEYPPALNLFDLGRERISSYADKDREKFTNTVIDQLTYVMDAMMGETAALTSKQETVFRYLIRLLVHVPEANLDMFSCMLSVETRADLTIYDQYIDRLSKPAQDFFNDQYCGKEYRPTKEQIGWRLARLRESDLFERMFSHPTSKLDLFTELNESKVILIHTDVENMSAEGTNILGRYFIGALLAASQERASLSHRLPVFAYIDECQDYIATDTKIATLLDQARKMKVGMFLAHQRSAQIKDRNVLDALANTAIKFASTDNPNDLPLVSKAMRTDPDFIATQPVGCFAVSARRVTEAFSFKVPFLVLETMDKMDGETQRQVNLSMRDKYYRKYTKESSPKHSNGADDAEPDISPTGEW